MHHTQKGDFEWETYVKGTRKILYQNLHLFDRKIIENVLMIDYVGERSEAMGPEPEDTDEIFSLYLEIRNAIEEDYKNDIKG